MCRSNSTSSSEHSGPSPSASATTITLTPIASSPAESSLAGSAPMRRGGSSRSAGSRPVRPRSLLQRGRSFTANDLAQEPQAARRHPIREENALDLQDGGGSSSSRRSSAASPPSALLQTPTLSYEYAPAPTLIRFSATASAHLAPPRLARSQSSSSVIPAPHAARDAFLAPTQPTIKDPSVLATPLDLVPSAKVVSGSWSDSDDESGKKAKCVKVTKPAPIKTKLASGDRILLAGGLGGGLRSPFEEKIELHF